MKKYFSLITAFIFFLTFSASAQLHSNRDLVGKWQGADMRLEFLSNSKVNMTIPGGTLPAADYAADFMSSPVKLTITLSDNGQKMTYKVLAEFISNDKMKLQYFGEGDNIDAFAKGRTIIMTKTR